MGVRLNKVLSELNIGLQTAIDFLKKKSSLGEVKDDATPNTKISDAQYEALVGEFKGDKAVKTQADMIFTKKVKEKKAEKVEKAMTKTDEDIYLDEFADEVDQWVIDAIKALGYDTAKEVLGAPRELLIEKADLEEETVDHLLEVLKAEFE